MNQKIESDLTSGLRPLPPIVERQLPAASAARAQAIAPVRASDSLHLTGEAAGLQVLQRDLAAAPAIDLTRVEAVREALANGHYKINPDKIAERMLELDALLG